MSYGQSRRQPRRHASGLSLRLMIAIGIVLFSVISFWSKTEENPITGEQQRVALTEQQEVQLGLSARHEMINQHGGLHHSIAAREAVEQVGRRLVNALEHELAQKNLANPYRFQFHLLADTRTVNAFALPGGQIFITYGLYFKLRTEAQLAGVLAHEIGHVIERHGAQRMAKNDLTQAIVGAAGVAGGDVNSAQMAQMVGQFVTMKYGRDDELESDRWAVLLATLAGYNPKAMLVVMDILDEASAGSSTPEILSTHPKPANRKEYIEQRVAEYFPRGLPPGLKD